MIQAAKKSSLSGNNFLEMNIHYAFSVLVFVKGHIFNIQKLTNTSLPEQQQQHKYTEHIAQIIWWIQHEHHQPVHAHRDGLKTKRRSHRCKWLALSKKWIPLMERWLILFDVPLNLQYAVLFAPFSSRKRNRKQKRKKKTSLNDFNLYVGIFTICRIGLARNYIAM